MQHSERLEWNLLVRALSPAEHNSRDQTGPGARLGAVNTVGHKLSTTAVGGSGLSITSSRNAARRAVLGASGPLLAACVAIFVMSMAPVLTRSVTAPAPAIIFVRLWTIVPIWFVVMKLSGTRLRWDVVRTSAPSGVLFGASTALSVESFTSTSIANATLIPSMQIIVIMAIAAVVHGERRPLRDYAMGLAALAGVLTLVLGAGRTSGASTRGDLVSVAGLFVFVGYLLRLKTIRDNGIAVMPYMFSMLTWAAIVVTPWALATAGGDLGQVNGWDWAFILGMNAGSFLIGHPLLTWAQASLDVTTTSLLQLAGPVVSMTGAWWVHGQRLNGWQFLGGAMVLGSLAVIIRGSRPTATAATT